MIRGMVVDELERYRESLEKLQELRLKLDAAFSARDIKIVSKLHLYHAGQVKL